MTIGLDAPNQNPRLDQTQNRWNQFLGLWPLKPVFAGRYFGDITPGIRSANAWVPGELSGLPAGSPLLQTLRYILPFAPPGPVTIDPAIYKGPLLSKHGFDLSNGVFFRQQGLTREGVRVRSAVVRSQGQDDANATCKQLAAALSFKDPVTGQPELLLPDSEVVFVYLDIEPQTALHPQYWLGWAETISSFTVTKTTDIGTLNLVQPFRPCLYCVVREDPIDLALNFQGDSPGPWPEITQAFQETGFVAVRIRGKHACHAMATPWPFTTFDVPGAIAASEAAVQAAFRTYGDLPQTTGPFGPPASVVMWQYRINIGMDAAGTFFDLETDPAHPLAFAIDMDVTRSQVFEGRPITDFMLRRP